MYCTVGNIGRNIIWQICHEGVLAGFKSDRFCILSTNNITENGDNGASLALVSCHFSSIPSYNILLFLSSSGVADVDVVSRTVLLSGLNLRPHPAQELALSRHMFIHWLCLHLEKGPH